MPFFQFDGWDESKKAAHTKTLQDSFKPKTKLSKGGAGARFERDKEVSARNQEILAESDIRANLLEVQGLVFPKGVPVEVLPDSPQYLRVMTRVDMGELKIVPDATGKKHQAEAKKAQDGEIAEEPEKSKTGSKAKVEKA